jgi:hypothetical protein
VQLSTQQIEQARLRLQGYVSRCADGDNPSPAERYRLEGYLAALLDSQLLSATTLQAWWQQATGVDGTGEVATGVNDTGEVATGVDDNGEVAIGVDDNGLDDAALLVVNTEMPSAVSLPMIFRRAPVFPTSKE